MAKTIKFNLNCDGKPIRTIGELQENFNIEDVLNYYRNGLLSRWLEVREYNDYLEKVQKIPPQSDSENIIMELLKIFQIEYEDDYIERYKDSIYIMEELKKIRDKAKDTEHIIEIYKQNYLNLIEEIKKDRFDKPAIQKAIKKIIRNYLWLFELNYNNLFLDLLNTGNCLAIVCFLKYEEAQKHFINFRKNIREDAIEKMNKNDLGEGNFIGPVHTESPQWEKLVDSDKKIIVIEKKNIDIRSADESYLRLFDISQGLEVAKHDVESSYGSSFLYYVEI